VSAARELRDDVLRRMRSIAGKEADDDETSSSGSGR
jgi:hypothetical protein